MERERKREKESKNRERDRESENTVLSAPLDNDDNDWLLKLDNSVQTNNYYQIEIITLYDTIVYRLLILKDLLIKCP